MKVTPVEGNPFETEDELSIGYKTTVVEGNPFEDAEVSQPEFGPLKENYKGIDAEVEAVLAKEDEVVIAEEKPSRTYSGKFFGDLETPPEKRAENREALKAFGRDVKKVAYSIPRGIVDITASGVIDKLTGLDMSKLEPKDREELVNKLTTMAIDMASPAFSAVDWNKGVINPETAKIAPAETVAGMGLQLGAFVLATGKAVKGAEIMYKGLKFVPTVAPIAANWSRTAVVAEQSGGTYVATQLVNSPKIAKGLAALTGIEATTQVMFDPDDTISNILTEAIPEDAEGATGFFRALADFNSTEKTDSEVEKRLRMGIENLGITAVFGAVVNSPSIGRFLIGKNPSQMSAVEKEKMLIDTLQYERDILNMQDPTKLALLKETDEGYEQVAKQRNSVMYRMTQKFFTQRGYSTPLMSHAKQNAKFTQKQLIHDAQFVANQLDRALASTNNNKELVSKTTKLLETDLNKILALKPDEQVSALSKKYNVPEDVASEVLSFRKLQDNLTKRIINMDGFSAEAKETLTKNLGAYIRRTYRAYEDPNYKPTVKVMEEAEQYYVTQIKNKALKDGRPITDVKALKQAQHQIKAQLKNKDEVIDYVAQVNRVAKIKKRKKLAPEVRALLGEITNPSEKIILSLAKLSRISEVQQSYNIINQLGKGTKGYIQGKENVARGLTVQIKGTNSILDNKWTTPEIEQAVLNKEATFDLLNSDNKAVGVWRTYIGLQGAAQSMQTVFNHVTHGRNAIGSASFLVANGHNPISKGGLQAFNVLENKIVGARAGVGRKTGLYKVDEKALSDYYSEMQGLGIVASSVNINQFRDMISTGFQGSDSLVREIGAGKSALEKTARKVLKKPEEIYQGTDDFAKIVSFESELKALREALPDAADDLLKQRAATIVKNTLPNYEAIPEGIKLLRTIPLGNFVSFPAEILRTSFHVVRQGSKEITSGNSVLRKRGLKRLAGFATANVGYSYLAKQSWDHYGMSDQEIEDRRVLKKSRFSSGHDLVYSMDEEGNYYTTNTEYLNSYYFLKDPVIAMYDHIADGRLKGKELDDMLLGAVATGIKTLTDPFTSESMVLAPWYDMATAALSEDGEDRRGRQLFPDKDSGVDKFLTVITEGLSPLVPGSAKNIIKLNDAFNEKADKWSGRFRDPEYAKLEQLGIKKDLYMADEYLKYAIEDYKLQNDQNKLDSVNLESTSEEMTQDFFRTNAVEFQYQQDLWIKASAYARIKSPEEALELLIKNKIAPDKADSILKGTFVPIAPFNDPTVYRLEALDRQTPEFKEAFNQGIEKSEFLQLKAEEEMQLLSLTNVDNFQFIKEPTQPLSSGVSGINPINTSFLNSNPPLTPEEREEAGLMKKATGGEVSTPVPNAPIEPDERINKLTGLPYNEGAGTAYMDQDDPMRRMNMAAGGKATTRVGRPTHQGNFGEGEVTYSERSVTFPIDDAETKWVTFPSVLDKKGTVSSEQEVRDYVIENGPVDPITGEEFPIHDSVEKAEAYAVERSDGLLKKNSGGKVLNQLRRNCK
mgnify:FL=1